MSGEERLFAMYLAKNCMTDPPELLKFWRTQSREIEVQKQPLDEYLPAGLKEGCLSKKS